MKNKKSVKLTKSNKDTSTSSKNTTATWQQVSKNRNWIIYITIFFVLTMIFAWWAVGTFLGSAMYINLSFFTDHNETSISTDTSAASTIEVETYLISRSIDGVIVDEDDQKLVPYAVMIENLLSVRPQSGLSQASVVYESLVEGGATRFVAIFDPYEVIPEIMPVRSARPYYLEWSSEYEALYAHAGGSPQALTIIGENKDLIDLEALGRGNKYFWRDTSKYAPHNLVTSSEKMNFALRDLELADTETSYQSWKYKEDSVLEDRGEDGKTLSFNFSYGTTYLVDMQYNQDENLYYRSNANQPHLDSNTGEQIKIKNVIVQIVPEPVLNGGKGRLEIQVGGPGPAWILRDGEIIEGTWKKESRTDRTYFYYIDGNELEFNRGNTWVHILPETQEVLYE
ncbi:MAG: DUF3048 domain-containing protein [Candidatus Kerfeldbacteria bacterium]